MALDPWRGTMTVIEVGAERPPTFSSHELRNEFKSDFDGSHGYSMLHDDIPDDSRQNRYLLYLQ